MTDSSHPRNEREAYPGGAAPDSGGAPIGDVYGAGSSTLGTESSTIGTGPSTLGTDSTLGTGPSSPPQTGAPSNSTSETVKDEAHHVRESAKDAGRHVADTAKDEARHVAGEAKAQARQLLDQSMHEVREQARSQQHRAADGMHTFGDDLRGMADGAQSGLAAQLVSELGERTSAAARWLEEREPADVLDEVKAFARRRPGAFIAITGVAGLLVGRLARGIVSETKDERQREERASGAATASRRPATGYDAAVPPVDPAPIVPAYDATADLPEQPGQTSSGTGLPTSRREAGL